MASSGQSALYEVASTKTRLICISYLQSLPSIKVINIVILENDLTWMEEPTCFQQMEIQRISE